MKKLLIITLILVCAVAGQAFDPRPYDITMQAGEDYLLPLKNIGENGTPINLTGYTYAAQFRAAPSPNGALFATYSTTIAGTAADGKFQVTLSKAQTLKLSGKSGVWDLLQIDAAGKATYLLSGKVSVRPTITRVP